MKEKSSIPKNMKVLLIREVPASPYDDDEIVFIPTENIMVEKVLILNSEDEIYQDMHELYGNDWDCSFDPNLDFKYYGKFITTDGIGVEWVVLSHFFNDMRSFSEFAI